MSSSLFACLRSLLDKGFADSFLFDFFSASHTRIDININIESKHNTIIRLES